MTVRKCLKCQKEFKSEHKFNRICNTCNKKNSTTRTDSPTKVTLSNSKGIGFN